MTSHRYGTRTSKSSRSSPDKWWEGKTSPKALSLESLTNISQTVQEQNLGNTVSLESMSVGDKLDYLCNNAKDVSNLCNKVTLLLQKVAQLEESNVEKDKKIIVWKTG